MTEATIATTDFVTINDLQRLEPVSKSEMFSYVNLHTVDTQTRIDEIESSLIDFREVLSTKVDVNGISCNIEYEINRIVQEKVESIIESFCSRLNDLFKEKFELQDFEISKEDFDNLLCFQF